MLRLTGARKRLVRYKSEVAKNEVEPAVRAAKTQLGLHGCLSKSVGEKLIKSHLIGDTLPALKLYRRSRIYRKTLPVSQIDSLVDSLPLADQLKVDHENFLKISEQKPSTYYEKLLGVATELKAEDRKNSKFHMNLACIESFMIKPLSQTFFYVWV